MRRVKEDLGFQTNKIKKLKLKVGGKEWVGIFFEGEESPKKFLHEKTRANNCANRATKKKCMEQIEKKNYYTTETEKKIYLLKSIIAHSLQKKKRIKLQRDLKALKSLMHE